MTMQEEKQAINGKHGLNYSALRLAIKMLLTNKNYTHFVTIFSPFHGIYYFIHFLFSINYIIFLVTADSSIINETNDHS